MAQHLLGRRQERRTVLLERLAVSGYVPLEVQALTVVAFCQCLQYRLDLDAAHAGQSSRAKQFGAHGCSVRRQVDACLASLSLACLLLDPHHVRRVREEVRRRHRRVKRRLNRGVYSRTAQVGRTKYERACSIPLACRIADSGLTGHCGRQRRRATAYAKVVLM